jgi:light-regulated signal transduction histidine kinase (bacteriophytochrome)
VTVKAKPFQKVSLNNVVRQVMTDLEVRTSETLARIDIGDLPEVWGDEQQIREVFLNLLSNALKFVNKDTIPQIRIHSRTLDHTWEIIVEDNGIGFEAEYLDQIRKDIASQYELYKHMAEQA